MKEVTVTSRNVNNAVCNNCGHKGDFGETMYVTHKTGGCISKYYCKECKDGMEHD